LTLTALISENVHIPVIASGGAGKPQHLAEVLTKGRADAALIASMVITAPIQLPNKAIFK